MRNYHTHTSRCRHAVGTDEEYVKSAINSGFSVLGFSEHAPINFPDKDYYSTYRMFPNQADEYARSINALRKKYENSIELHLGFEIEFLPKLFDDAIKNLRNKGAEYFILGQHFTDNEYENYAHYCGNETNSIELFDKYINQSLSGLKTGQFLYIAHPDLFNYTGPDSVYIEKMTYFCKEIKKLGYPLEFNLLGFERKRNYPDKRFWEIAASVKNDVVIGVDAHSPNALCDNVTYNNAIKYLSKLNINPIEIKIP